MKTMRSRLVRMMLVISGLTGVATFATVVSISVQTSSRHVAVVQAHIEEGIVSKGKVLTRNHALALRGLILDNAFADIQRSVERAIREDEELVYGIFVSAEGDTLALARRDLAARAKDPPDKKAWQAIGLTEAEISAPQESVQRAHRLGQDLLEVAVPVVGDEGEQLGSIRYGLSTRRMHEALSRAEVDGNSDLVKSVTWLASLIALTTFVGLLLSRLQAYRITRPIEELTQAARGLAAGDRGVRVNISSGDELELLGSSFNDMVAELASSYQELEQMNATLEQKVDQRTRELGLKNRDMRLVLDNVDQGFATLTPDGRMAGGRSRVLEDWFGKCPDAVEFAAYIAETSSAFGTAFDFAWSQVVEGILPLELALDQLPARLAVGGRTWSFRYLPFFEGGELEGVLVVVAEITERLAREREEAEQRELMQSFTKLMLDRNAFSSFLREADRMIGAICSRRLEADRVLLKRTLHTLKGNTAVMGLGLTASLCHALEEQLDSEGDLAQPNLDELSTRWARIREHVEQFVPNTTERAIEIPASGYAALIARLSEDRKNSDLLEQVLAWGLEPAARPLERLAEQARALATKIGKGDLEVLVDAGGVRLAADQYAPFFSELVHVIRNAVDHGIEAPEERARRSKQPGGRLVLSAKAQGSALVFEVSDDGKGIDWELIRRKASERGLPHETPADLLDALCHDGITTRSEVTETSGRGVGMAAFKACVERMRGHIEVKSSARGTTWSVSFPARPPQGFSQHPEPAAGASATGSAAMMS